MVDFHNGNVRSSRFSPYNYHQTKDKTNPKYHISNSWNNLPFVVKASQPDDFLEDLSFVISTHVMISHAQLINVGSVVTTKYLAMQ